MDLTKKVGPLPLWAWIGVMAGIGYIAWKRAHSTAANEGVEEGWFPTQGIPAEGAAGSGVAGAEELLQRGQEAAEQRQITHEEAQEQRTIAREEAAETRAFSLEERRASFEEWMAKHTGIGSAKPKGKKPSKPHKKGGGGRGKRGHGRGNGNDGQPHHASQNNHQPGHTAKTDHRPPRPPAVRLGGGFQKVEPTLRRLAAPPGRRAAPRHRARR